MTVDIFLKTYSSSSTERIIGGRDAKPGEAPYQARIRYFQKLVHLLINVVVPLFLLVGFLLQLIVFHKMIGLIPKAVQNFGSVLILEIVAIRYCDC